MPDVEPVEDGSVGVREKGVARSNPLAQCTIHFRGVDTDSIDLNTIGADSVIIVLELLQLHAAKRSPVATIKEVEGSSVSHQAGRVEQTALVIGEDDGDKGLADGDGQRLFGQL